MIRVEGSFKSPSDTHVYPTRQHLDVDPPVRAVGEGDAEFSVELGLVLVVGVGERAHDVT